MNVKPYNSDEEEIDTKPYEGPPDYNRPQVIFDGKQDDDA